MNFQSYGFSKKDELELLALTTKPEKAADGKRITDVFSEHFFDDEFLAHVEDAVRVRAVA